jgi:hypothetical protein
VHGPAAWAAPPGFDYVLEDAYETAYYTDEKCGKCLGKGVLDATTNPNSNIKWLIRMEKINAYLSDFNSKVQEINDKISQVNELLRKKNEEISNGQVSSMQKKQL